MQEEVKEAYKLSIVLKTGAEKFYLFDKTEDGEKSVQEAYRKLSADITESRKFNSSVFTEVGIFPDITFVDMAEIVALFISVVRYGQNKQQQ